MRHLSDGDLARLLDTPLLHTIGETADSMGVE